MHGAASFSVVADTLNNIITIGTYEQYQLINTSTNADSYSWNFGNDSTSVNETPIISHPKSGSYVITLTVQNTGGQKSTITKNVKVLDRVIKQVVITGLAELINYPLSQTSQSFNNSNVWVELKLSSNNIVTLIPQVLQW
jgi:PKD repeat protein